MVAICGVVYHFKICTARRFLIPACCACQTCQMQHAKTSSMSTCICACLPPLQLGREGFTSSHGKFQAAPKADVMSAAFLPSQWLVTGSPAGELLLWDARGAQPTFGCCCQVGFAVCVEQVLRMAAAGTSVQEAAYCGTCRQLHL
jgi:hypothetical protein